MKFEIDYIEKLAKIIADNELTEISLEEGNQAITIRKDLAEVVTTAVAAPAPAPVVCQTTVNAPAAEVEKEAPKGKAITSPMVGTFYAAPSPDAEPYLLAITKCPSFLYAIFLLSVFYSNFKFNYYPPKVLNDLSTLSLTTFCTASISFDRALCSVSSCFSCSSNC